MTASLYLIVFVSCPVPVLGSGWGLRKSKVPSMGLLSLKWGQGHPQIWFLRHRTRWSPWFRGCRPGNEVHTGLPFPAPQQLPPEAAAACQPNNRTNLGRDMQTNNSVMLVLNISGEVQCPVIMVVALEQRVLG